MKKIASTIITFVLFTLALSTSLHAQNFSIDSVNRTMNVSGDFNGATVHLPVVAKHPEYPGGKKAWKDFLRSNISASVPFSNKATPGTYKVMIRFIVGSDGKLSGIGADTNCGFGLESEVIRCIRKSTDWTPAETSGGTKVAFTLRTLVIFEVKQNDVIISLP